MTRGIPGLVVVASLLCGGCVTHRPFHDLLRPVELGKQSLSSGGVEVYRLEGWGPEGNLQLVVERRRPRERPRLGFFVRELEQEVEDGLIQRCLTVNRVVWQSPAEAAGLLVGDILVSVNGTQVYHENRLADLIQRTVSPGDTVTLTVRRPSGKDFGIHEIVIESDAEPYTEVTRSVVPLSGAVYSGRPYAGLVLGTLPPPWSEKIFAEKGPVLLVGNVTEGSPAYHAGLRTGDRIVKVAGREFRDADELARFISEQGARGETVAFEVMQDPEGRYETEVKLKDFTRTTSINVPLLFHVETNHEVTRWKLGPFGWLMEYEGRYLANRRSREKNYHRRFEMILDLVSTEFWSDGYKVDLLWVIGFGTR